MHLFFFFKIIFNFFYFFLNFVSFPLFLILFLFNDQSKKQKMWIPSIKQFFRYGGIHLKIYFFFFFFLFFIFYFDRYRIFYSYGDRLLHLSLQSSISKKVIILIINNIIFPLYFLFYVEFVCIKEHEHVRLNCC